MKISYSNNWRHAVEVDIGDGWLSSFYTSPSSEQFGDEEYYKVYSIICNACWLSLKDKGCSMADNVGCEWLGLHIFITLTTHHPYVWIVPCQNDLTSWPKFNKTTVKVSELYSICPWTDKEQDIDVNQVLVLHKGNMLPYGFYKMMTSHGRDEDEVREYASLVGKTCAEKMLLVRK